MDEISYATWQICIYIINEIRNVALATNLIIIFL